MSAQPRSGPATIVATVEPGGVVKLTLGLAAGTTSVTLWRVSTATGHSAYVRGWYARETGAATVLAFDYEAPLGVELVYYVDPGYTPSATAPVVVESDQDWLVDLGRPTNTMPILVESLPEASLGGPVGVHRILDRRDPILTAAAAWTPGGTLTFVTATLEERDRARAALGAGVPFLLRTPPERGVGNLYLGVVNLAEQRVSRLALHADRRFVVETVQVARPDPQVFIPAPPLSYADRLATWATYADVTATGKSYQELAYETPPGGVDPFPPWLPDDI